MQAKKVAQLTGHNAAIFDLVMGKDERHVLSGAGDGWVVEWDLENPDMGRLLAKVERQIFSLLFLKNLGKIVAGDMDGGIHWIDLESPAQTKDIAHHQKGIFALKAVGNEVFSCGGDGKLSRWSVEAMRATESFSLSNQALRCIAHNETKNELAIGSSDGCIYLLDATTLAFRHKIAHAHGSSVFSIAYSPNGQRLFSGGRDAHLNAWDLENGFAKISSQPAHWYTINSICASPDGQFLVTGSRDKTLKIWDACNLDLLKVLEGGRDGGHFNSVNKVLWLKSGILSCSDDRTMIQWQVFFEK